MNNHAELLKEVVNGEALGLFGSRELDMSNPKDAELVVAQFGGKEWFSTRYPLLWQAYNQTVQSGIGVKGKSENGFCDNARILGVGYDSTSSAACASGIIYLTQAAQQMCMVINVYEEDELVARNVNFLSGCATGNIEVESAKRDILTAGKNYHSYLQVTWREGADGILRSMVAEAYATSGSEDVISNITVSDPKHIVTSEDRPIKISYGRDKGKTDYYYEETRDTETHNEMVFMKVTGSMDLADGHTISAVQEFDAALFCDGYGAIQYEGSKKYGNKGEEDVIVYLDNDGKSLCWNLEESWKTEIEQSVVFGNRTHIFDMIIPFQCDNKDEVHQLRISSSDATVGIHVQKIPMIQLMWGCLAKDTKILMADGTEKAVSEIAVGDQLMSTDGSGNAVEVSKVTTGKSENIYTILLENGDTVRATRMHPFAVPSGEFVTVIDMNTQTMLKVKGADTGSRVVYCYPDDYNSDVYNIDLKSGNSFYANGIVSGTNEIMGMMHDKHTDDHCSITVSEQVLEEIEKLREDYSKGLI